MKILLDECVPWPMYKLLTRHECKTAQQMGWSSLKNGDLLKQAEETFELFITSDQNIRYQQNLAGRKISILELSTNNLRRIEQSAALIRSTIEAMQQGDFVSLDIPKI